MSEKSTLSLDEFGNQFWRLNGLSHRDKGPAITITGWYQEWYQFDELHRTDGPAVVYDNLDFTNHKWYINGLWCRTNKEFQEAAGISNEDMLALVIIYGNIT